MHHDRETTGQTNNVDSSVELFPGQHPEGNLKIVSEHRGFVKLQIMK